MIQALPSVFSGFLLQSNSKSLPRPVTFCMTRPLPTAQIPVQPPSKSLSKRQPCVSFCPLYPCSLSPLLAAFPLAISSVQIALFTIFVYFAKLTPMPLSNSNLHLSLSKRHSQSTRSASAPVLSSDHPVLLLIAFNNMLFYVYFFKMSVSSKRIRGTSALFNTRCCKIGTASGHNVGLLTLHEWSYKKWEVVLQFLAFP